MILIMILIMKICPLYFVENVIGLKVKEVLNGKKKIKVYIFATVNSTIPILVYFFDNNSIYRSRFKVSM